MVQDHDEIHVGRYTQGGDYLLFFSGPFARELKKRTGTDTVTLQFSAFRSPQEVLGSIAERNPDSVVTIVDGTV